MKKILLFILTVIFLQSCVSSNLLVKKSRFKKEFKKILVIPLYVDKQLIPDATEERRSFNLYSKQYKKNLYNFINSMKGVFDKEVKDILENGIYKVETVWYKGKSEDLFEAKRITMQFNRITWDHNYFYNMEKETAEELIEKYNVDGILFHYIQVFKRRRILDQTANSKLYGPVDILSYVSILLDKKGKVVFNNFKNNTGLVRVQEYQSDGIFFKDWKTKAKKLIHVKGTISKWFINKALRTDIENERAYYKDFLPKKINSN